jgi:hypothetical protein
MKDRRSIMNTIEAESGPDAVTGSVPQPKDKQ